MGAHARAYTDREGKRVGKRSMSVVQKTIRMKASAGLAAGYKAVASVSARLLKAVAVALVLALAACSQGAASSASTVTVGSGSAAITATQLALPEAMALMRADYVGTDAYGRGIAYGFGKDGDRTIALFACYDRTTEQYRSWFGDYEKTGEGTDNTVTITDDTTGDTVQLTFAGTTQKPKVYAEVIDNPGDLTAINYGSADAARNFLKSTDKQLVDLAVVYVPQA